MKSIFTILSLSTFVLTTSSLVVHDLRSPISEDFSIDKRNAYQVGVNIMNQPNCQGNIVATRNHDENSLNAATVGGTSWLSARVKDDGTTHGYGCLSIFSDSYCGRPGSTATVYALDGGACVNFAFEAHCVVVTSRDPT